MAAYRFGHHNYWIPDPALHQSDVSPRGSGDASCRCDDEICVIRNGRLLALRGGKSMMLRNYKCIRDSSPPSMPCRTYWFNSTSLSSAQTAECSPQKSAAVGFRRDCG